MSDTVTGVVFAAVAFPMCMLVVAFVFWKYIRERDLARTHPGAPPSVTALRWPDGASPRRPVAEPVLADRPPSV